MIDTVEYLQDLAKKLNILCDISNNNVTFGETQEDIQREKVESQKIYFNDRDLFVTNILVLKYHIPCIDIDLVDKSITEEDIEKLSYFDTSTFQITTSIFIDESEDIEFLYNKTIKIVDTNSGLDVNFELTLSELMKTLEISREDLIKDFDAIEDEEGDIEYIDLSKVNEFVKSLKTPDWTYVIIQLLLNK